MQIGITLIGIFAGAYGGVSLAEDMVPYFQQFASLKDYAFEISFVITVGTITYFSLVIGELVPKTIAFNNPEGIAMFVSPIMVVLSVITRPIVIVLSLSTKYLLKILFIKPKAEQPVSEEELKILLEHGTKFGSFDKYEVELVKSIFKFGDRDAYSIMTNRQDVIWIDLHDSLEVIKEKIQKNKFSNYPVCEDSIDNIVGIVNTHTLLTNLCDKNTFNLRDIIYEPLYIPDTLSSFRIIEKFKASNIYVALVVDEFGSIEGMITKQDLLENIIGEFPGASDKGENQPILQREDGSWLVNGTVHIDDLIEKTSVNLEVNEAEYVTIAGFVMSVLGKIPVEGDHFEYKGYKYEVMDMDGKRVDKILIKANPISEIN